MNAAVLVVDGIGEMATTFLGGGTRCGIHRIAELRYPNSIGFVWEKMSAYLGFSPYDASKVMGLASYGNPDKFFDLFNGMVGGADILDVRSELFQFRLDTFSPLEELLGPRRNAQEPIDQRHSDIAATLQDWNNSTILALAERVYEMHPAGTLCYSGGVALNCTTNWVLKEKGPFTRIHIPPAPHDGGTAAGAALHAYHVARGPEAEFDLPSLSTPYTGPQFDDEQILAAFAEMKIVPVRSDDPALEAAERIADGQVVGWFQGRMEIGPRALGNRSLLADPRDPHMRDMLNRKVKHREDFRPFAPSVLAEHAATWFSLGRGSESYDYMLYTCSAHPELAQRIPAVVHTDGTSRVQLVSSATNPLFHSLIGHFHDRTGVPMVLNTSFNDSEPIVCTPQDALKTFLGTKIDAVVIGNYTASRAS